MVTVTPSSTSIVRVILALVEVNVFKDTLLSLTSHVPEPSVNLAVIEIIGIWVIPWYANTSVYIVDGSISTLPELSNGTDAE